MTILEGLNLPDRQFAVFCRSNFSLSSEGCCPPHCVLLHLHLAALPHHDGGGAHGILEELHRGVLPMLPQALQQQRAAGEPQAVQEACYLYFELSVVSIHNLQCNVISKKSLLLNFGSNSKVPINSSLLLLILSVTSVSPPARPFLFIPTIYYTIDIYVICLLLPLLA